MMDNPIFDLEQEIMQCWHVVDDIDTVTTWFVDDSMWESMDAKLCDALMNKYLGIKEVYDVKFDKLFKTFEKVCKEYHQRGKEIDISFADDCVPSLGDVYLGDDDD